MRKKIALIVATRSALQPALDAFARYAPDAAVQVFADEGLLPAVQKAGGVTPHLLRRFFSLLALAEKSGVDGILFSCSVFSPSLERLEPFFSVPLMSADSAMIAEAAARGGSVGVIATVEQAEKLTVEQLHEQARLRGKALTVRSLAVPEAFSLLPSDPQEHDALIFKAAEKLVSSCDRIVLAQISMARAAEKVAALGKPVLTSLESSVNAIMRKVG